MHLILPSSWVLVDVSISLIVIALSYTVLNTVMAPFATIIGGMTSSKHKKRVVHCKICASKECDKLNRDMILHGMSGPELEKKYGFLTRLINGHRGHVGQKLALAHERKERDATDQLLADVEKLWQESCDFLDVSKSAVKTQAVTDWVEEPVMIGGRVATDEDGQPIMKMVQKTTYKEYRDLGATATAIRVAQENRRLFGDATGAIHPPQEKGGTGIVLHIVMPGMQKSTDRRQIEEEIIETTAEEIE